jgi:hypothetical protein
VTSLLSRALHQAARMRAAAARSGGALTLIHSAAELDAYVTRRRACLASPAGCPFTAGLLVRAAAARTHALSMPLHTAGCSPGRRAWVVTLRGVLTIGALCRACALVCVCACVRPCV